MKRGRRSSSARTAAGDQKKPAQKGKQKTHHQTHLSVGEIVDDSITALSLEHWADDGKETKLSLDLVKQLYEEVLCGENLARIQLLETSKYLES